MSGAGAQLCRPPDNAPPVSIVRPLRGLEPFSEETLGATFDLDYPDYEIIFCVQSPSDPVISLVERLIAAHPEREARLLVGDDYVSANPKLNNCVKGWDAARHHHVISRRLQRAAAAATISRPCLPRSATIRR